MSASWPSGAGRADHRYHSTRNVTQRAKSSARTLCICARRIRRSGPQPRAAKPVSSEPVEPVQRGHLVGFRERRVVEDVVDEVVDRPAEGEYGLADVHELGGLLPDEVHATE